MVVIIVAEAAAVAVVVAIKRKRKKSGSSCSPNYCSSSLVSVGLVVVEAEVLAVVYTTKGSNT